MLRKRCVLPLLLILLVVFAFPVVGSEVTPNGPFVTDTQEEMLSSFYTYEELVKELNKLENRAKGNMTLEVLGQSRQGRDIFLCKVGRGDKRVFVITQQHGNEPHGTQAAVELIKTLITDGNPTVKKIMDEVTLYIVPRLNPDGCELWQRYNYDPSAPNPRTYAEEVLGWPRTNLSNETYGMYSSAGRGWDLNRFHFADWTTSPMYQLLGWPTNPGTESEILAQYIAQMDPKPVFFVDVHNQGSTRTPEGELVTFALDTAHMTNDWDTDLTYPLVQDACRLLVVCKDAVSDRGNVGISRYLSPSAYRGRSRNQYMQNFGVPGILIEMRLEGQKSNGYLNKVCELQLLALLDAAANDTWQDIDWTRVNEITKEARSYNRDLPASDNHEDE